MNVFCNITRLLIGHFSSLVYSIVSHNATQAINLFNDPTTFM